MGTLSKIFINHFIKYFNFIMKLIGVTSLVGLAYAGFNAIDQDLQRLAGQRNVAAAIPALEIIRNYGCWCFFDDDHGAGKSHPVDTVDAACKNLHLGYECCIIDGPTCAVPWEQIYNAGTSGGMPSLVAACNQLNSDPCAQCACNVEGAFTLSILGPLINQDFDLQNKPDNGFDFRTSCPVTPSEPTDERECCGLQPFRYPFKPTLKECCGASTFDPTLQDCCDDNVPRFSCV